MIIYRLKQVFWVICFCLMASGVALAQQDNDNNDQKVPAGMEMVHIDNQNLLVPIGTVITKQGGLISIEDTSVYMARHLTAIEARLTAIETRLDVLEKESGYLQNGGKK